MAELRFYDESPVNFASAQIFAPGAEVTGFDLTRISFRNPDGSIVDATGSGITVEEIGGLLVPTAGTIGTLVFYDAAFTVQRGYITGANTTAVALHTAWLIDGVDVLRFLLGGADQLNGSDHSDILPGGTGGDSIAAGGGNDLIEPGAGADSIDGGDGDDDLVSYADAGTDPAATVGIMLLLPSLVTDPWGFTDTLAGIEAVRGTHLPDTFIGATANLRYEPLGGTDTVQGGSGIDMVSYAPDAAYGGTAGVSVNLISGVARDGFGSFDALDSVEWVRGTNALTGNTGNYGPISGAFGDHLVGNGGINRFQPLGGNDVIDGRSGTDTIDYSQDAAHGGTAGVTVALGTPFGTATDGFGNTDVLYDIENVIGTAGDDTIGGNAFSNTLTGGLGNDTLSGGFGIDTAIFAGPRAAYTITPSGDTHVVSGPDGTDTLDGIELGIFDDVTVEFGTPHFRVIADTPVLSEDTGAPTLYSFRITRTNGTFAAQEIDWAVSGTNGVGTRPADAADFVGGVLPAGTVSFAPGEVQTTFTIAVAADAVGELNERFAVTLGAPPSGSEVILPTARALILNDDTSLRVLSRATDRAEGHAGPRNYTYLVQREGSVAGSSTVQYAVDGDADADDFAGGILPSGTLSFAPGERVKSVTVQVAGDIAAEADEAFRFVIHTATGAAIRQDSATSRILADDFASTAADEALSGTASADVFLLGGGLDTVLGGGGLDRFLFQPSALGAAAGNAATLQDFNRAAGEKIDLSAIDAIAGTPGNDAFAFIGTAAFTAPGQLRWQNEGGMRLIQGDVDGDTMADLTLFVQAAGSVNPSWFVL
jgi:Ca2+-binding RTX toxin-like protein